MTKRSIKDTSIVLVGAGNLATNLAKALYRKWFRIVQVYSRTLESARNLALEVNADYTIELSAIVPDAKWYVVSLTDTAFMELLPDIVKGKQPEALWVHTSGSVPMSIWEGHVSHYGVLYPLQTFSKQREVDFQSIPIFVEGASAEDTHFLKTVGEILSDKVYEISSEQRKRVHLAAVFACNFANYMYALSDELLRQCDLPFDVMLPLIDETAHKVHVLSPREAQTGPAIRYDEAIINEHLRLLADRPQLQDIYRLLSDSIHQFTMKDK